MAAQCTDYFSFGLVGDPQYADKDNGNVEGRTQRYREVPDKLRQALQDFKEHDAQVAFVLTLGDLIDGRDTQEETNVDLEQLGAIFDRVAPMPVHHVVGNHDLAVPRDKLLQRLTLPASYYSHALVPGWRLIVLDTTDLCPGSGYKEDSVAMSETRAYEASHPIEQYPNMTPWNGGLTSRQLMWLQDQLHAAEAAGERVIVACHHPVGHGSARDTHMAWNWLEVQLVLSAARSVVLVLSGHDHMGGYACIEHVHYVTLEAMLEAPTGSNAYATVHVHQDHIQIRGVGTVTSRKLAIPDRLVQVL